MVHIDEKMESLKIVFSSAKCFFFLINFDIFQIQTKSNKAWPSSLQAEVTLAGRLSEHKQKEIKDSSAYFAAS